ARLGEVPGLGLPSEPRWARSNWQSYCVRLPEGRPQREVMQRMLDAEIATKTGIMCAHREPAYRGVALRAPLPHSESAQDRCILLPLFVGMTEEEQGRIAAELQAACGRDLRTSEPLRNGASN